MMEESEIRRENSDPVIIDTESSVDVSQPEHHVDVRIISGKNEIRHCKIRKRVRAR